MQKVNKCVVSSVNYRKEHHNMLHCQTQKRSIYFSSVFWEKIF